MRKLIMVIILLIVFISLLTFIGCGNRSNISEYEMLRMEPTDVARLFIDYWNDSEYANMKELVINPDIIGIGYNNWMINYDITTCEEIEKEVIQKQEQRFREYEMCDYTCVVLTGNIKTNSSSEINDGPYEMRLYLCKYQNNSPWLIIPDNLVF